MKDYCDSYCGIYCGACDIRLAGETGIKDRLASFWTEPLLRAFQKTLGHTGLSSESLKVECHGCKSENLFINCAHCNIRTCAIGRKLEHCIECPDYPCSLHTGMQKASGVLPHLKNNHPNLEAVQKTGTDPWLREQEQRWQCPECHMNFAWYWEKCAKCGTKLTGLTYKFTPVQAFLLKVGVRLASLRKAPH